MAPATYTITVGMPSLSSPTNQALGESTTPTLTWRAATDATSCTVCPDMSGPRQQHYTVSGTGSTPSTPLQASDLYYWYVVGNSGSASGPAPTTWSFRVTSSPSLVSATPSPGGLGTSAASISAYDVHIRGGIAAATVHLFPGVGIYTQGARGIAEIRTQGLRPVGGHWINDAHEDTKVSIHLDIHGGIGEIRPIAD